MKGLTVENPYDVATAASTLFEKGYSGVDLMRWLEHHSKAVSPAKKYEMLLAFQQAKAEFRNESLFLLFVLTFAFLRSDVNLESMDEV